jgi:uncharacterized membrane-anchored protein YjiN (DUF445 family)
VVEIARASLDPATAERHQLPEEAPRNSVGTISLVGAVVGAIVCHVGLRFGPFAGETWLRIVAAGFEAAMVGGLADWFAVTALFRHPLGIPIPHTALLYERRGKIIEGIVMMVEKKWLAPDVIGKRLQHFAASEVLVEWLRDPAHVERLGAPVRDVLRSAARVLTEPELADFVNRAIRRQLRDLPIDRSAGEWLITLAESESGVSTFEMLATSLANLVERPRTAEELRNIIQDSARKLRDEGKRLIPLVLRRQVVQRKIIETACGYLAGELRNAVSNPRHPFRDLVLGGIGRFGERLAAGDPDAVAQAEQVRQAIVESLEAGPLVRDMLARLRATIEEELESPSSSLSELVDREVRSGILEVLDDPGRRAVFDDWVRHTAQELLKRHHHQIGVTVRENLEALDPATLIGEIEDRVGGDLQFIRLNGAVVGGMIGILIALAHWALA